MSASVIGSNNGEASATSAACVSAALDSMRHALPRSMRRTASRPQTCAMSVALDDQGETVPGRGTVSRRRPSGAGFALASKSSRRSRTAPLGSGELRIVSTKWMNSTLTRLTRGSIR